MSLPIIALPTSSVDVGGVTVNIHSLSRTQALKIRTFVGRADEAENYLIACGTGETVEEAAAWRDSVSLDTAGVLIDAIAYLSGMADPPESEESDPNI